MSQDLVSFQDAFREHPEDTEDQDDWSSSIDREQDERPENPLGDVNQEDKEEEALVISPAIITMEDNMEVVEDEGNLVAMDTNGKRRGDDGEGDNHADTKEEPCQISLLDHCIFCLRKTSNQKEVVPQKLNDKLIEMLQVVPRAQVSSVSLSAFNKVWPYLQQQQNEGHDEDLFGFVERNVSNAIKCAALNQLPTMCQFCANKLETLHRLCKELMAEMKRLGEVVRESKYGGEYSWRAEDFEAALQDSALERESVQITLQFMGKLEQESMVTNDTFPIFEKTSPPEQVQEGRRAPSNIPDLGDFSRARTLSNHGFLYEHSDEIKKKTMNYPSTSPCQVDVMNDFEEILTDVFEAESEHSQSMEPDPLGESDTGHSSGRDIDYESDSDPDYIKSEVDSSSSDSNSDDDNNEEEEDDDVDEEGEDQMPSSTVVLVDQSSVKLVKKKGNPQPQRTTPQIPLPSSSATLDDIDRKRLNLRRCNMHIATKYDRSTGTEKFICTLDGCGKTYKNKTGAQNHLRTFHKVNGEGHLACNLCQEKFETRTLLNKHEKRCRKNSDKIKKFAWNKCDLCKDSLPKAEIYDHVRAHVGEEYVIKCPNPSCTHVYTQPALILNHLKYSTNTCGDYKNNPDADKFEKSIHACEVCEYTTSLSLKLRSHLMKQHEVSTEKKFPCPIKGCQRKFAVRQSVVLHLPHHDFSCDVNYHYQPCDLCQSKLKVESMEEHLRVKHNATEIIKCYLCDFLLSSRDSFLEHLFKYHRYSGGLKCDICDDGVMFARHVHLRAHYVKMHNIGQEFPCEDCGVVFLTKEALTNHIKLKHNDKDPIPSNIPTLTDKVEYKCNECNLVYKKLTGLQYHNIRLHGADPFKCRFCGETFTSRLKFLDHEREHRGLPDANEKELTCEVEGCGKVFKGRFAKKNLERHRLVTHLGERPHVCEFCGNSFSFKEGLKHHMQRVHMGLRPHICETCGDAFANGSTLRRHKLIHTGDRPFSCEICGQRFRQREVLKRHVKAHERKGSDFKPNGPMKEIRKRVEKKRQAT